MAPKVVVKKVKANAKAKAKARAKAKAAEVVAEVAMADVDESTSTLPAKAKGARGFYWMVTSYDLDYQPWLMDTVRFVAGQMEIGENGREHLQLYIELYSQAQGKAVGAACGQTKLKNEHGLIYFNIFRNGTQQQAIDYCTSTWYCRLCSLGDHTEAVDCPKIKWAHLADKECLETWSLASPARCCHKKCEQPKDEEGVSKSIFKGKQGPMIWHGTPSQQHGGPRSGDAADQFEDMLVSIKGGMRHDELADNYKGMHARYHTWCERMIALFFFQPIKCEFTHLDCCKKVGFHSIPFDSPKWQHVSIVCGNPGIGKTRWALSHFNEGLGALFCTHIDDVRAFNPKRFGGIVFDDLSFAHLPICTQKYLCDWVDGRTIHCRYSNAWIPAKTKKIFTCNFGQIPLDMNDSAVNTRVHLTTFSTDLVCLREMPSPTRVFGAIDQADMPMEDIPNADTPVVYQMDLSHPELRR
jgi:hypothetical protein